MANFYGTARTNYFKVKDAQKFQEAMAEIPNIEVVTKPEDCFGIMASGDSDSGCFPGYGWSEENGEEYEIDLPQLVSKHLREDEVAVFMEAVAVFMEAGAEKLRYISGWSLAVNSKGEEIVVSLSDIYKLAIEKWGCTVTPAEY